VVLVKQGVTAMDLSSQPLTQQGGGFGGLGQEAVPGGYHFLEFEDTQASVSSLQAVGENGHGGPFYKSTLFITGRVSG